MDGYAAPMLSHTPSNYLRKESHKDRDDFNVSLSIKPER